MGPVGTCGTTKVRHCGRIWFATTKLVPQDRGMAAFVVLFEMGGGLAMGYFLTNFDHL